MDILKGDLYEYRKEMLEDLAGIFLATVLLLGGIFAIPWTLGPGIASHSLYLPDIYTVSAGEVSRVPVGGPDGPLMGFYGASLYPRVPQDDRSVSEPLERSMRYRL